MVLMNARDRAHVPPRIMLVGGQNECKGHGFIEITADECEAKGGTVG